MKNLAHQTKQAFLFSLVCYVAAVLARILSLAIFPVLGSLSILLSLIWVVLVLRELMLSRRITDTQRLIMVLVVILFNIIGGLVYFYHWRKRVL